MENPHHAKAVLLGDNYEGAASRLNDDGDGVVSINGFTVFVPNLLATEAATIKIVSVHRRFARGQVVERHNNAIHRVTPPCPVHGVCGGCHLQHLEYPQQLQYKQQIVARALSKLPQARPPEILPILGMKHPFRYRNQVQVPVEWDNVGKRIRFGFFARDSHTIVETPTCHLEPFTMERTVAYLVDWLMSLGPEICATVHHIIVRESSTAPEQLVIFALRRPHPSLRKALADLVGVQTSPQAAYKIVGVALTVQPQVSGPVWGQSVDFVAGTPFIHEQVGSVEFLISARSFFQVNHTQSVRLVETVQDYAKLTGNERVLDAYCGTGMLALALAKTAGSVIGIESIPAAIADANHNADHNQIDNVQFLVGQVEIELPRLIRHGQTFDLMVLDPPRKGVHPAVIEAVLAAKPRQLIYVSCNPTTLGRDATLLVNGGYQIDRVQPVDMFPQTSHVECVVATYYEGKK